jgi:hypothetical protein
VVGCARQTRPHLLISKSPEARSSKAKRRVLLGSLLAPFRIISHGKNKVTFRPIRNADDDWTVIAKYPGAAPREITGFKSKADIDDWMNGDRKVGSLRSQGYAK